MSRAWIAFKLKEIVCYTDLFDKISVIMRALLFILVFSILFPHEAIASSGGDFQIISKTDTVILAFIEFSTLSICFLLWLQGAFSPIKLLFLAKQELFSANDVKKLTVYVLLICGLAIGLFLGFEFLLSDFPNPFIHVPIAFLVAHVLLAVFMIIKGHNFRVVMISIFLKKMPVLFFAAFAVICLLQLLFSGQRGPEIDDIMKVFILGTFAAGFLITISSVLVVKKLDLKQLLNSSLSYWVSGIIFAELAILLPLLLLTIKY